jgi:hypothetical protein
VIDIPQASMNRMATCALLDTTALLVHTKNVHANLALWGNTKVLNQSLPADLANQTPTTTCGGLVAANDVDPPHSQSLTPRLIC